MICLVFYTLVALGLLLSEIELLLDGFRVMCLAYAKVLRRSQGVRCHSYPGDELFDRVDELPLWRRRERERTGIFQIHQSSSFPLLLNPENSLVRALLVGFSIFSSTLKLEAFFCSRCLAGGVRSDREPCVRHVIDTPGSRYRLTVPAFGEGAREFAEMHLAFNVVKK